MSNLPLSAEQLDAYRGQGHVTVTPFLDAAAVEQALADLERWGAEFLRTLSPEAAEWYLETGAGTTAALRKLDHPVYYRDVFRRLATTGPLSDAARQLLDDDEVSVFFSQVFLKPPEVGGPKPAHQDNFYFGPADPDALVTAWVALDDASEANGCLHYVNGSHAAGVLPHGAPSEAPYNLQIAVEQLGALEFTPAPVPRGGVSFHHGNTIHCSGANLSDRPRRAVAIHYRSHGALLAQPALDYDMRFAVKVP